MNNLQRNLCLPAEPTYENKIGVIKKCDLSYDFLKECEYLEVLWKLTDDVFPHHPRTVKSRFYLKDINDNVVRASLADLISCAKACGIERIQDTKQFLLKTCLLTIKHSNDGYGTRQIIAYRSLLEANNG